MFVTAGFCFVSEGDEIKINLLVRVWDINVQCLFEGIVVLYGEGMERYRAEVFLGKCITEIGLAAVEGHPLGFDETVIGNDFTEHMGVFQITLNGNMDGLAYLVDVILVLMYPNGFVSY